MEVRTGGLDYATMSKVAAAGSAGILAGALSFVSFAETRTFLELVKSDDDPAYFRRFFRLWWPHGREFMVPLITLSTIAHAAASSLSGDLIWLVSGGLVFSIAPFTALAMSEDIENIKNEDGAHKVPISTSRFCHLQHVRLGLASVAFVLALFGITKEKTKLVVTK